MPEPSQRWPRRFLERLLSVGAYPGEPIDTSGRRRVLVGALWFSLIPVTLAALNTSGTWMLVAELSKAAIHIGVLVALVIWPAHAFRPGFRTVFAGNIASDLALTAMLGGLFLSGFQIGWSLIAVLGALIAFSVREATVWFVVFLVAVFLSGTVLVTDDPLYMLADDPQVDAVFTTIGMTVLVFLVMAYFVRQRERFRKQSDDLLHSILPNEIADRLKDGEAVIADTHPEVTVLFADVVDFTPLSSKLSADEVVHVLNAVFSDIDAEVQSLGLQKIKTIGDEYMVAAGVPLPRADHAHVIAELALRIQSLSASKTFDGHQLRFRIGINSGPVVAGVIGDETPLYDLWGDVVNTASRMESHGVPGRIQITQATRDLLGGSFACEPGGQVDVKGKGVMDTWFLEGRRESADQSSA